MNHSTLKDDVARTRRIVKYRKQVPLRVIASHILVTFGYKEELPEVSKGHEFLYKLTSDTSPPIEIKLKEMDTNPLKKLEVTNR